MAPNKRKKKALSNPARGFATQSVASKSKAPVSLGEDTPTDPPLNHVEHAETVQQANADERSHGEQASLHDLSPDELEIQLEEAQLQLFIEKHGESVTKDTLRQTSRLQTEKRLLRPQADHLILRSWLPDELMVNLQTCVDAQLVQYALSYESRNVALAVQTLPEDVLLARLWILEKTLRRIGFQETRVHDALRHILHRPKAITTNQSSAWGLEECLEAIALSADTHNELLYDIGHQVQASVGLLSNAPIENDLDPSMDSLPNAKSAKPPSSDGALAEHVLEADVEEDAASSGIDTDDDNDPTRMIDLYVAVQRKLFAIQPELTFTAIDQKSAKRGKRNNPLRSADRAGPKATKLLHKLSKLESDLLFDREEAQSRWTETRARLVKDSAERRRLRLDDPDLQDQQPSRQSAADRASPADDETSSAADKDITESLGDLFNGYDEEMANGAVMPQEQTPEGTVVTIQDFGKPTGLRPRKILEDACKARDSKSKVVFAQLNPNSNHSYRSSLSISWSRQQIEPLPPPIANVSSTFTSCHFSLCMNTISTPDPEQAVSYIATVALYVLFSHSQKEANVHLRLPSTWKNLWMELWREKQKLDEVKDKEDLRNLKKLVGKCQDQADPDFMYPSSMKSHCATTLSSADDGEQEDATPRTSENPQQSAKLWSFRASTPSFQHMLIARKTLPIWNYKSELLRSLEENQAVIICGETGCGKSTQFPSFILEHEMSNGRPCKIYCAQPRRISAISLARRVSEELGERRGDIGTSRSLVGYAIRLETKQSPATRLIYATTGVILRLLERASLGDVTHLILDEVHERTIDNDFLIIVLRALMARRPTLKVVLMSATVNASKFAHYFGGAPIVTIPGRTHPVETAYLEDAIEVTKYQIDVDNYRGPGRPEESDDHDVDIDISSQAKDHVLSKKNYSSKTLETVANFNEYCIDFSLIVKLLETIATSPSYASYSKAILVFLPGLAEIRRLSDTLAGHPRFSKGWRVFPLHSTVAMEEQELVFQVSPRGMKKIILSTNIAETGITVPDITCVIDTGKHREMRFDERRQLSRLIDCFISRANAKQRRGRAGRVQKGMCFHLFTKVRHDTMMSQEQTPEMLRLSLQDLVLRVKICKLGGIEETLAQALDPPAPKAVQRATSALVDVKALTLSEDLTPLGRQLAQLPLDVFLGKLVLLGSIFSCLDGALTIAAMLSSKSPFSAPMGSRSQADQARLAFKRGDSDLLTLYNAYCSWRRVCSTTGASEQQFCRKNYLSHQTLSNIEELKAQLTTCLVDAGYVELNDHEQNVLNRIRSSSRQRSFVALPERYNTNNENDTALNSVICWSFYPKLLKREGKGWRNVANNQIVSLHPTSVNKGSGSPQWLSFYSIMQSSSKFYNAHETSAAEAFAIALVCGEADFKMFSGIIVLDGNRVRFGVDSWKDMLLLKYLRQNLKEIMTQAFRNPGCQLSVEQQTWLDIWQQIFARRAQLG